MKKRNETSEIAQNIPCKDFTVEGVKKIIMWKNYIYTHNAILHVYVYFFLRT